MEVRDQIHFPVALRPGREPAVSTMQEAGWAPFSAWTFSKQKYLLPLPGVELSTVGRPTRSLASIAHAGVDHTCGLICCSAPDNRVTM